MQIIKHRINKISSLKQTPQSYGVEIDIRSLNNKLILQHDPFTDGDPFEDWLNQYFHQFIILNCKEEGLEPMIVALLKKYNVDRYIFLDSTPAIINKYRHKMDFPFFCRVSYFESIEKLGNNLELFSGIWIDTFKGFPLSKDECKRISNLGLLSCLVSPELIPHCSDAEIIEVKQEMDCLKFKPNMVCTKTPDLWEGDR